MPSADTTLKRSDHSQTPSFFDEPEDVVDDVADDADELDEWHEVSQPYFLSWSLRMQLHYCWRRDMDAALRTSNNEDAVFYLERAARYKQELDNAGIR